MSRGSAAAAAAAHRTLMRTAIHARRHGTSRLANGRRSLSMTHVRALATASGSSKKSRRAVTVLTDDGRVGWSELSGREKAARTAQQTFNFGLVVLGAVMTGGVAWLLWTNVASPESKTALFNRSVTEIRASGRARELLGSISGSDIRAFGQAASWNRWTRNAAIPAEYDTDAAGVQHARLTFHVQGPTATGVVRVHLSRRSNNVEFEFRRLSIDVPGQQTLLLYSDEKARDPAKAVRFLGFDWSRK